MGQSLWSRSLGRILLALAMIVAVLAVPIRLAAQDPVVNSSLPWYVALLAPIVPIVSGYLAKFLADGLKQILPAYDNASTLVKSVVSVLIGLAVGWLNAHLVLVTPLGADVHGWTADALAAVLTAAAQAGIYRLEKNKQLAAQGSATLEQKADGISPPR